MTSLYDKARQQVDQLMNQGHNISDPDAYARAITRRHNNELSRNQSQAADNAPLQTAINQCNQCDHTGLAHYLPSRMLTTRDDPDATCAEKCRHQKTTPPPY